MAISTIKNPNTVTSERYSASSLGIDGDGNITVFKQGRMITLVFNLAFSSSFTYGQTAWTLPNNLKPIAGVTFNLTTASKENNGGYFEITTTGDVICYGLPSTSTFLNGCITYAAAS